MTLRIIDGVAFERNRVDYYRVKTTQFPTGHFEATVSQAWEWQEIGELSPEALAAYQAELERLRNDPDWMEERAEAHARRAAQRAKQRVRHLCKSMGADTLITLTYRENVTDLETCKRHLREFVRRVTRVLPGFRAVCAFEQQKRGAWHVHMATERIVPVAGYRGQWMRSFDLLRAVWRSVTQSAGGNVDVQRRKRHSQKSPARIAAYLSKYLAKTFHDSGIKHANRWTRFGDIEDPRPVVLGTMDSLSEAMGLVYSLIPDGQGVSSTYLSSWQDVFFLVAETRH